MRQLNKAEEVLRHLTSDMDPVVKVTKTLMLPNVTSGQLLQALGTDPTVSKVSDRLTPGIGRGRGGGLGRGGGG